MACPSPVTGHLLYYHGNACGCIEVSPSHEPGPCDSTGTASGSTASSTNRASRRRSAWGTVFNRRISRWNMRRLCVTCFGARGTSVLTALDALGIGVGDCKGRLRKLSSSTPPLLAYCMCGVFNLSLQNYAWARVLYKWTTMHPRPLPEASSLSGCGFSARFQRQYCQPPCGGNHPPEPRHQLFRTLYRCVPSRGLTEPTLTM